KSLAMLPDLLALRAVCARYDRKQAVLRAVRLAEADARVLLDAKKAPRFLLVLDRRDDHAASIREIGAECAPQLRRRRLARLLGAKIVAVLDHVTLGFARFLEVDLRIERCAARSLHETLARLREHILRTEAHLGAANETVELRLQLGIAL